MSGIPHRWVPSTLGHGDLMCERCHITNREAVVLDQPSCLGLRSEVADFAALMERELRNNDERRGPAGWKGMALLELLRMLHEDVRKLNAAVAADNAEKIIEQCADVANMAMMIADVTRKGS